MKELRIEDIEDIDESDKMLRIVTKEISYKNHSKTIKLLLIFSIIFFTGFIFQFLDKTLNQFLNDKKKLNESLNEKIIHIGFYEENLTCAYFFREVKGGFFTQLLRFDIKISILAKNGLDENCFKYSHLDFIDLKGNTDNCQIIENAIKNKNLDIIIGNENINNTELKCLVKLKKIYNFKLVQIMHEFPFYYLYYFKKDSFNEYWQNLKDFDAVLSFTQTQIYYYHKQGLTKSIYIPNHLYYDPRNIVPVNLQNKNLIMIAQASDERSYELGIKALQYIINEIPEATLTIVSKKDGNIIKLMKLVENLSLSKNVIFTESETYLHNFLNEASIYLSLSNYESYSYIFAEAKAHGLASVNTGKKYLTLVNSGTINIDSDDPKDIANACIKLFKNQTYLNEQGGLARKSLEEFYSENLNEKYYNIMKTLVNNTFDKFAEDEYKKINIEKEDKILKEEFELLQKRKPEMFGCMKYDILFQPKFNINCIEKRK